MNTEFLKELKKMYSIAVPYDKNGDVNKNLPEDAETFNRYYNQERGKYYEYFNELIVLTQDLNPLEVLSYFSIQRMIFTMSNIEDDSINIFQLEILQYIMLCNKNVKRYRTLDYSIIEKIKDYLLAISFLVDKGDTGENSFESIQIKLKQDTAYLRINHVPDFDIKINKNLFSLIDKSTNYELGVNISSVMDMFFEIIKIRNKKILNYINYMASKGINNIDLNYTTSIMTYSVDDFVKAYSSDINKDSIKLILDKLSFTQNEDLTIDYDSIFFKNPVWNKFLIKVDDEKYLFPLTETFIGRVKEILEYLIEDKQSLDLSQYSRHIFSNFYAASFALSSHC